ncbi:MAG: hypothetical protein H7844_11250 [Nitrospirae bacterium YQR-1]
MESDSIKEIEALRQIDFYKARDAQEKLTNDLNDLNKTTDNKLFTRAVEGRAKDKESLFKKLFKKVKEQSKTEGLTYELLKNCYLDIKDKAGVRFACHYSDQIEHTIETFIRPHLNGLGYAAELRKNGYEDENYLAGKHAIDGKNLSSGRTGYRAYHFFVGVVLDTMVYDDRKEIFICEVQGRSSLQDVWGIISHELIYKQFDGWEVDDEKTKERIGNLMNKISDSLDATDSFLIEVRNQVDAAKKRNKKRNKKGGKSA